MATPSFNEWNEEEVSKYQHQPIREQYANLKSGDQIEVKIKDGCTYIITTDSDMIINDLTGAVTFNNVFAKDKLSELEKVGFQTDGGKIKMKCSPLSTFARREVILTGISHKNIEPYVEISTQTSIENTLVTVSSWDKFSLASVMRKFTVGIKCQQKVILDLLDGLEYMHKDNIGKIH